MKSLADLRREIDQIDDAIHDLIMRRTALLSGVAQAKALAAAPSPGSFLRPGREANILRRLVARHRGSFPKPALVRLWRELISAPLSIQGAFSVAVFAPKDQPGYWDLARDHYGSHTPFVGHSRVSRVLGAVTDGSATIGVVPTIQDGHPDPWWRWLAREDGAAVSVVARLPMAGQGNARGDRLEALVVAPVHPEPTGRDRGLIAFEADHELSRALVSGQLAKARLEPTLLTVWQPPDGTSRLYLAELHDFVTKDDARVAEFLAGVGSEVRRVFFLGGYAVPFDPAELAARE